MPGIGFRFDSASTYPHPAALRIEGLAAAAGVAVDWRPMLVGPIFAAQGRRDSPFNIYPAKGAYMRRDMDRLAAAWPPRFPANGVPAAGATWALPEPARAGFAQGVVGAQFVRGQAIDAPETLAPLIAEAGADPDATLAAAQADGPRAALRAVTVAATAAGIFGAPSFTSEDREPC